MPRPLLSVAVAATLFTTASAQAPRLLAAQSIQSAGGPADLVEIDLTTLAGTTIGQMTMGPVDGLAWSPSGVLYAADNANDQLVTIDPLTGAVTSVVGVFNTDVIEGLAFHPVTGLLYGLAYPGSSLVQIDLATAQLTYIGTWQLTSAAGIAFSPDGSTLYVTDWTSGELFDVDVLTGVATPLTTLNPGAAGGPLGLTVHPQTGDLYVAEWRGGGDVTILRVAPGTFAQTPLGTVAGFGSIEGLTFTGDFGLGTNYCTPAVANSTGAPAEISASGSPAVAQNDLTLEGTSLPAGSFAFFLTSRTQGFVPNPGGSQGILCLGGQIGRYVGPGQIQQSNAAGEIALALDLTQTPQPTGFVAVAAGETWNFQGWYRDAIGGTATSNFTDGLSITFQ